MLATAEDLLACKGNGHISSPHDDVHKIEHSGREGCTLHNTPVHDFAFRQRQAFALLSPHTPHQHTHTHMSLCCFVDDSPPPPPIPITSAICTFPSLKLGRSEHTADAPVPPQGRQLELVCAQLVAVAVIDGILGALVQW
jgi:hypothetical protein